VIDNVIEFIRSTKYGMAMTCDATASDRNGNMPLTEKEATVSRLDRSSDNPD
jgi:hypothetical protein